MPDPDPDDAPRQVLRHFTTHEPALRAFIRRLVPSRADADDILQEVSIVLWEKFGKFRADDESKAWAFGIARFKVLSLLHTDGWNETKPGQVHWMVNKHAPMRLALHGNTLAPGSDDPDIFPDSHTPVLPEQGRWVHLAAVHDAKARTARFYLNGELDKEGRQDVAQPAKLGASQIGNWYNEDRKLSGRIDHARVIPAPVDRQHFLHGPFSARPHHAMVQAVTYKDVLLAGACGDGRAGRRAATLPVTDPPVQAPCPELPGPHPGPLPGGGGAEPIVPDRFILPITAQGPSPAPPHARRPRSKRSRCPAGRRGHCGG